MEIKPIAYIHTDFTDKFGIPRQAGRVPELMGRIVFVPEFRVEEALRGIKDYSHLWLLFDFSMAHRPDSFSPTVRPPRLGGNTRVGVFASRSPFRPNSIGLSAVRLVSVEKTAADGTVLIVSGIDMLDNTPIYDIKPYVPHSDCISDARGSFSDSNSMHRLKVVSDDILFSAMPHELATACIGCIADDPRPGYDSDPDKIYHMKFGEYDVHFCVDNMTAEILKVDK